MSRQRGAGRVPAWARAAALLLGCVTGTAVSLGCVGITGCPDILLEPLEVTMGGVAFMNGYLDDDDTGDSTRDIQVQVTYTEDQVRLVFDSGEQSATITYAVRAAPASWYLSDRWL